MDKFKFKTVGQFLVALEEGPLYCNKNCKFTMVSGDSVRVKDLSSKAKAYYYELRFIKGFVEERVHSQSSATR